MPPFSAPRPTWRSASASALALAASLTVLASCSDRSAPLAPMEPPDEESTQVAAMTCTVQVARRSVTCDEAAPTSGARRTLMFGKQGTYVRLVSTGAGYDPGTEVFSVDVTVQNLLAQPMGTSDGTTVTGVRVFFPADPAVTGGSGTVSVANPDGTGTFTATDQPYFEYAEILDPLEISSLKNWQFAVDATVETFTFLVYVHTSFPNERALLHWKRLQGTLSNVHFRGAWSSGPNDVHVAGQHEIHHWDGEVWRKSASLSLTTLLAMWGSGPRDVWAVGNNGKAVRFNGRSWTPVATGTGEHLYAIWGAAADTVYVVGNHGAIRRFNGTTWTGMASGTSAVLYGVWGATSDSVYAVGNGGTILRLEGGVWTPMTSGTTRRLWSVWGSGRDDVFAVGDSGTILHYDGTGWTPQASGTTATLFTVEGRGSGDVYAGGQLDVVLHYDGTDWEPQPTALDDGGSARDIYDIWLAPGADYMVGSVGTVLREDAGTWEAVSGGLGTFYSVWANSPSDVFVGRFDEVLHFNGTTWTSQPTPGFFANDLWASGPNDAFAVGEDGAIWHYDGASWQAMSTAGAAGFGDHLYGVWGSGPNDVWAVGDANSPSVCMILHYDGSAWSRVTGMNCGDMQDVWGTSASHVLAISEQFVYRYNGSTWQLDNTFPYVPFGLEGVFALGPNHAYVVGPDTYYFDGFGWTTASSSGGLAISGTSEHNIVVVGLDGAMRVKTASGWLPMGSGTHVNLRAVAAAGNVQMFAVGAGGTILHGLP